MAILACKCMATVGSPRLAQDAA